MNDRHELLVEMDAACDRLTAAAGQGDRRRYVDDPLFRCAIAYLWLRSAEPAAQLLSRRLVDHSRKSTWSYLPVIRNSLAHDREQQIDYDKLWDLLPTLPMSVGRDVDRLLACG